MKHFYLKAAAGAVRQITHVTIAKPAQCGMLHRVACCPPCCALTWTFLHELLVNFDKAMTCSMLLAEADAHQAVAAARGPVLLHS